MKWRLLAMSVAIQLSLGGMVIKSERGDNDMMLKEFIDENIRKTGPLELKSNLAYWNLATTGNEKYAKESQSYQVELREYFSSRKDYEVLTNTKEPSDEDLARQREILLLSYQANQIPKEMIAETVALEVEIEDIYTKFRPTLNGQSISNNDIKDILTSEHNSVEREKAWVASKRIGEEVEAKVLELIRLRNAAANAAGFNNYYSMQLKIQEIDEHHLFDILNKLEKQTNPIWASYKEGLDQEIATKFGIKKDQIRPWHYSDPFFQEAPPQGQSLDAFYKGKDIVEVSKKFYEAINLPVDDILARSDLFERKDKNQHAFCIDIDRKEDIRILCNIRDNEYWMGTQLHELGHAVYYKYIDQNLPYLLRNVPHTSTTEAIAMLFGRFSKNGSFLEAYLGVDKETAKQIDNACKKQNAAALLVFARWVLVMCHFEREMYQNKNADLRSLWWDMVEKYQGVRRPEGRHLPDWASKLHLACAPVYYQNYLLGEMTASQLLHKIQGLVKAKGGSFISSAVVGSFLTDHLFRYGARYDWEETVKVSTGEYLNAAYFVEDVSILKH